LDEPPIVVDAVAMAVDANIKCTQGFLPGPMALRRCYVLGREDEIHAGTLEPGSVGGHRSFPIGHNAGRSEPAYTFELSPRGWRAHLTRAQRTALGLDR